MTNIINKTLEIYWKNTKGHRMLVFFVLFVVSLANAVSAITPLFFKSFFDILSSPGDRAPLYLPLLTVLAWIAGLDLARWLFLRFGLNGSAIFQTTIIYKLGNYCFAQLHKHSFSYFNNNFVGTLVKRFNWFIRAFESIFDKIIWNFIPLIVNVSIVVCILLYRKPALGIIMIVWIIIFLIINYFFTRHKLQYDIQCAEAESKATGILSDTITNNGNVKLYVGYQRELSRYAEATEVVKNLRQIKWKLNNIFDGVQEFMGIVLEVALFYFAINYWREGKLTLGDFALIQSSILFVLYQIWGIGKVIRYLYTDLSDAAEMTELLTTPFEIKDAPAAKELVISEGKIDFSEVSFFYHETRKIIEKFNLAITPHEKVGLVGPSGAGKTTIIKLLLRMHDLSSGKILIDGQKINQIKQESLWNAISLVPQDPILFHRTLMENIRYGKPDATDEEVIAASKLAHCHEFVSEFPEQYKTFVGERGMKLSGGERQRVAIARAILRNAPILVLDEATSSLDSESESLIQDALATLMKNKTVIVIAHRLSTIMKMDRIVVLDHGTITEQGSHADLLKNENGLYRQLWQLQAGGFMTELPTTNLDEEHLETATV